jgi:hypothetical protein
MYTVNASENASAVVADDFKYPSTLDTAQFNINGWRRVTIPLNVNRSGGQFIPQIAGSKLFVVSADIPVAIFPSAQALDAPIVTPIGSKFDGQFSGLLLTHADYSAATLPLNLVLLVCVGDSDFSSPNVVFDSGMPLPATPVNSGVDMAVRFPIPPGAKRISYVQFNCEFTLTALAVGAPRSRLVFKRNNSTMVAPTLTGYAAVVAPGRSAQVAYQLVNAATFAYRLYAEYTGVGIPSAANEIEIAVSVGTGDTINVITAPNGAATFATCYVE